MFCSMTTLYDISIVSLQTNTFQAILCTDGQSTYTIFNYGQMTWTEAGPIGGQAALVGFHITCTLLLSLPQLDNRQLRCCNITFYCMLEWGYCIGIEPIDCSHCVT